ncbi:MAG TPA: hypothetical protein VMZ52_03535 [Bryobacteraceae bacterium]|nr:hypothetical protein [Bryobacteraceae bacterium]
MSGSETLQKLSPHRDLQCYFEHPSAIAAMSGATAGGFTVSGTWRQQFDWAVIEWNRDNVFEHPTLRSLPDEDLSGLTLTYEEERDNAIPIDSDLYPTVDWPFLRIWWKSESGEVISKVRILDHAVPIEGSYTCASVEVELQGTVTGGDYITLGWLTEHHTHQAYGVDTLDTVLDALVDSVRAFSPNMWAVKIGTRIRLYYITPGRTIETSMTGADGNRIGVYCFTSGAGNVAWDRPSGQLAGGTSPTKWRIALTFATLTDSNGITINSARVRKMRWTYSADFQKGAFARSEFAVRITNWICQGSNRAYRVAGPGSRRIESDAKAVQYAGHWTKAAGNFSAASIQYSTAPGSSITVTYMHPQAHALYLGTRGSFNSGSVSVSIDGGAAITVGLYIPGEDVLMRAPLGALPSGEHSVRIIHSGAAGTYAYFDFLEIAMPTEEVRTVSPDPSMTLATDWDTDHSIALAPERTAWLIHSLGFHGRVNHYVGALWFYELAVTGHHYASVELTFTGVPAPSSISEITITRSGAQTVLQHLNLFGDTAESVAKAFELELNRGYTAVRAEANANVLIVYSRSMGADGNELGISASPNTGTFQIVCSASTLTGGTDGEWHTDLTSMPRLNRAVRDWCRSFYFAIANYGLDVVAAFSTELQHGDTSLEAGIAQRYPSGNPVTLNTPALQTNFSPVSRAFWQQVYLDMAQIMAAAGHRPYLQFGEVQWWYFPYDNSGLPFYDEYTKEQFQSRYGVPMRVIADGTASPALFPEEAEFLPTLIGEFTQAIMAFVRQTNPDCRFEVLYPTDVNDTAFNRAINFPAAHWTPATLDCLKTESFTYTYSRNLDSCLSSILFSRVKGFPNSKRSHLIGIGDPIAPWVKEASLARAEGAESVVLFALDQFCLIGFDTPVERLARRSVYQA